MRFARQLLCLASLLAHAALYGQSGGMEALLAKLPANLREQGRAVLAEPNEAARAKLADALGRGSAAGTREFLLGILETDPAPGVRRAILDRVMRTPNPAVMDALARHASSDPDAEVAIFALDRYRYERMLEVNRLLNKRLELSPKLDHEAGMKMLDKEQERWISLLRGTMLPAFMQTPPPLFSVKPGSESIRVLAFGDYGNGSKNQRDVAMAMKAYHDKNKFDFGITLGDNFYSKGMLSTRDPNWKRWWDDMYDRLGIRMYASLGNHDWGYADSPAAEVMYTNYTFTAGPVQFFALDTNEISRAQLTWLNEEIGKSTARWKVVYGHHPIYSVGAHADSPRLIKQLLPVLSNRVDVFIAGHDHDMQHLKTEAGVHFFVAGGAGAGLRPPKPDARTIFAEAIHGFSVLDVSADAFHVRFLDTTLKDIYAYKITK
jgi:tartrate-resistant acid phosphatase type 5